MAKDPTGASSTGVSATEADHEKLKASAKAEKADADKAGDKDALPNLGLPDTAGHKGTIAIDGDTPVEALLLAYQSVHKIAATITARVLDLKPSSVLIHNPADFKAIADFKAFKAEASLINDDLRRVAADARKLLEPAPAHKSLIAVGAIGAVIASGLQLLSLFRVDHKLKSSKIEIEDQVLAITVAGVIRKLGTPVYNTALVPLVLKGPPPAFAEIDAMKETRSELVGLGDELHALIGDPPDPKGVTAPQDPVKDPAKAQRAAAYARVVAAVAEADAFLTDLAKIDTTTGASRLSRLIDAQNLTALMDGNAMVLWLKAVAAGGGSHAKEGTFTSDLTYSGGAIASFAVYDRNGELLVADTISMYSGFVRVGDLPTGTLTKFDE